MMTFIFDYEELLWSGVDALTYLYPETADSLVQALEEEEIKLLDDYADKVYKNREYHPIALLNFLVEDFNADTDEMQALYL